MGNFSILAIAVIIDDKNSIIGYRLLNTDGQQAECKNIPKAALINALEKGNITVENLAVVSGEYSKENLMIVGTQGSIDRLPSVKLSGELVGNKAKKSPLTIVNKLEDVGYTVADYKGAIKFMRVDEVVAYSKEFGITNGKVVTRNGVEFISAINGAYKEGKLKRVNRAKIQARDIVENGEKTVRKGLTKADNLKGIVRTADLKVSEEIEYNDTFRLLNEEQRKAIRSYYAWWTVKTFEGLAGSRKLEVTPKKAAELAKLKRNVTWSYRESIKASVYCQNGYDYCTLGHKLKTVHFAMGVDDNTGEVETIKFGSTCIADFFDISVEGVRKLDKVAGIMSEEIELMTNIARENKWDKAWKDVGLLSGIVEHINEEDCKELFGEKVGEFLILFKQVGLAYPASMVKMAREYANEKFSTEKFWKTVYKDSDDYLSALDLVFKSGSRYRNSTIDGIMFTALEHLYTVMLEGIYSYDPIKKVGDRGKGRFTKEAVYRRKLLNSSLRTRLGITQYTLEEVDTVLYLLSSFEKINKSFSLIVDRYTGTREFREFLEENRYNKARKLNQYNENIVRECRNCIIEVRSKKITQDDYEITDEDKAGSYINQISLKVLKLFRDSEYELYMSYDKIVSNIALLIPGDEFTHSINESVSIYKVCIDKYACEKIYEKYLSEQINTDLEAYRLRKQRESEEQKQERDRLEQLKAEMEEKERLKKLENEQKLAEEAKREPEEINTESVKEEELGTKELTKLLYENDKSNGTVCLNESCEYNHEGNCKVMMALGKVYESIKVNENNLVSKCDLTQELKTKYTEAIENLVSNDSSDSNEIQYNISTGKKLSELDALAKLRLLNRDGIYEVGIEDASATYIAKDIIKKVRYDTIGSLSYKQKLIIENELNRLEAILDSVNLKYDYADELFRVSDSHKSVNKFKDYFKEHYTKEDIHKMGDISDGENRTYNLNDHKDIKIKLEKVITAVDNNGIDLDSKTISIVKTVLMRGKFSDKQYKYIKQAIESLSGE